MRLFITCPRRYPHLRRAAPILAALPAATIALLGDNPGAEQQLILALYTRNPNLQQRVFHADWANHHSHARAVRDDEILAEADAVLAFTDGTDHFDSPDRYLNRILLHAIAHCLPLQVYDRDCQLVPPQPNLFDIPLQSVHFPIDAESYSH
jgi:hypothetical protein